MSVYVVDSNFFIQAHRLHYPLDVAFSFWNKVKQLANDGKIISIDKVKDEIYHYEGALKNWCEANLPADFFKDTNQVVNAYYQVAGWAASKSEFYLPNAINEFLDADEADAWLVAYVLTNSADSVLVTYETSEPGRKSKIKIPDVCIAQNVQCTNTINMLRDLGETF